MFAVNSNSDGTFNLQWGGSPILSGCHPILALNNGTEPEWAAELFHCAEERTDTTSEVIYRRSYRNADQSVQLNLWAVCSAEKVRFHASVWIPNVFSSRELSLHPEHSVRLEVRDEHSAEGMMANYITYRWWTRPAFANRFTEIPGSTQALLWKSGDSYIQALAGLSDKFVAAMHGTETGLAFQASSLQSGCREGKACLFILAAHKDPYEAYRLAAEEGIKATGGVLPAKAERSYPDMLEYLGFCSWDAFQRSVSTENLLDKAEEFRSKKVPVRWFIIDEGWLDADEEDRLNSFRADGNKFPGGLQPLVRKLKTELGLAWVGVWHPITGFWNGVNPESPLAREMAPYLLSTSWGRIIPHPDTFRGFPFWREWHDRLRREGVDFVKVDSQSTLSEFVKHDVPVGLASRGAHAALEASVGMHFGMRMINCMGMRTETIWSRPQSAVSRNSDDFFPKKEHSFREHAMQNAYNSLYHGQLYWGDWDMWWTNHPYALQNAILRAVSGGPVYISDPAGATLAEALWPLILADGRVLRCDSHGMPTVDLLFRNPLEKAIPLKVWNRSGEAGVVGAWNINEAGEQATGTLAANDVPGLMGERFAVLSQLSGTVTHLGPADSMPIVLNGQDCELYIITPLLRGIAVFGLTDKYISPATIRMRTDDDNKTTVLLKEGGVLGFASAQPLAKVLVAGVERELEERNGLYTVSVPDGSSLVEIWR